MHPVDTARRLVEEALGLPACEAVELSQAVGRFLAAPVIARRPVPPYACSAMDGWAVRAAEAKGGARLRAGRRIFAGDLPGPALPRGEAARVFTGAPLPEGADAVVREEAAGEQAGEVSFAGAVAAGENVRRRGEDVAEGAVALERGARLGPRQLGLCRALGVREVEVAARPRVFVLATGDEIVKGLIEDSNRAALACDLERLGCRVTTQVVGDDREAIAGALEAALAGSDAVLTIAGVSVGEKDHVPAALGRLGAEVRVHGVAMKPGKPFLFALAHGKPVFGLPGTPSACLVAYEVFARPFVLGLLGAGERRRRVLVLPLAEGLSGRPGRARFVWAALTERGEVKPLGQGVSQLRGPAQAQVLVRLAEDVGELPAGAPVQAWLLDEAAP